MILNLTQHTATPDQIAAGVVDLPEDRRRVLQKALTFEDLPSRSDLEERADCITGLVRDYCQKQRLVFDSAMIGGAPFFMPVLAEALKSAGLPPVYAFSQRIVEEQEDGAGGVRKVAVFRHVGFVPG